MVIPIPHTVLHYTEDDVDLFGQWLDSLTYLIAQAAIAARLVRLGSAWTRGSARSCLRT